LGEFFNKSLSRLSCFQSDDRLTGNNDKKYY